MLHWPRAATAGALTAVLVLGATGPAQAQDLKTIDARGDVFSYLLDDDEPMTEPAPEVSDGDIVSTVFRHTAERIIVKAKLAQLRKVGEWRLDMLWLVTNEGVRRDVTLFAGPGIWAGETEMTRGGGSRVRCAVRHRIDYDARVVEMSIPRSCVSNPRWVRADFGSGWFDGERAYVDGALTDGSLFDSAKLTPRLRRG